MGIVHEKVFCNKFTKQKQRPAVFFLVFFDVLTMYPLLLPSVHPIIVVTSICTHQSQVLARSPFPLHRQGSATAATAGKVTHQEWHLNIPPPYLLYAYSLPPPYLLPTSSHPLPT